VSSTLLMGMTGRIATLAPSDIADIAVFKLVEQKVTFIHTLRQTCLGN
jgi:predicted amidohydrolase